MFLNYNQLCNCKQISSWRNWWRDKWRVKWIAFSVIRSSSRNVLSGEERGETDVFAGYFGNTNSELHSPVADPGEGPGGSGPPPYFRPNWDPKGGRLGSPYLSVWMTTPTPPPFISRSGSGTALYILFLRNVGKRQTSVLTELLQIR